jgi:DNA segregation ATPase FtsK/SpoIIIE, S-DNA-T family
MAAKKKPVTTRKSSRTRSTSTRGSAQNRPSSSSRSNKRTTSRYRSTSARSKQEPGVLTMLRDGINDAMTFLHNLTLDQRLDIIGVLLTVTGLVSLLGFFYRSSENIFGQWGVFLTRAFGWSIYIMPVFITLLGVWLILRRFESLPVLTVERAAGILLFLATVTIWLQIIASLFLSFPAETQGGGFFGRLLANPLNRWLGLPATTVLTLCLTWLSIMLVFDLPFARLWSSANPIRSQLRSQWHRHMPKKHAQGERLSRKEEIDIPDDLPQIFKPISEIISLDGNEDKASGKAAAKPDSRKGKDEDEFSSSMKSIPPDRDWILPNPKDILRAPPAYEPDTSQVEEQARIIEETLDLLGAPGHIVEINHGPRVTQFGVEPDFNERRGGDKIRVRVNKLVSLADDLTMALASQSVRIQAPVPGKSYVGIEVPNTNAEPVVLAEIIETQAFQKIHSPLRFGLGKDVTGRAVAANLKTMPHLLIAGTTGAGKSVCVNSILCNFLFSNSPRDLRLLLVDPKRVELTGYNGIPHLLAPVVVEMSKVVNALQWILREMETRYHKFSKVGARNLMGFNQKNPKEYMPHIVVVVDELADLMMTAPGETESAITRLAQLARATGIHLILATQRPSTKVITGLIKANFPARIAFNVASGVDSRVILDSNGAERLLGKGDMLFKPPDQAHPFRLQGVFVSDDEIDAIVNYWRTDAHKNNGKPPASAGKSPDGSKMPSIIPSIANVEQGKLWDLDAQMDPLTEEAIELVRQEQRASTTLLQRKLRIGYTRAARIIDHLANLGIIGDPHPTTQIREILDWGEEGPPDGYENRQAVEEDTDSN